MTDSITRLRALGWTELRAAEIEQHLTSDKRPARVIAQHRGSYVIDDGFQERRATLSGKLRHKSQAEQVPAVGDWVLVSGSHNAGSDARVEHVLPRVSALIRGEPERPALGQVLAANVDTVFLGAAFPNGVNMRRLERAVALVWESGAVPVVLLTKADLSDDSESAVAAVGARLTGVQVLAVSTLSGSGIEDCLQLLKPATTAVLVGPSGIGKSTLLNALLGSAQMRTSAIRPDGKGRHTTTHRELFQLPNGALLIDTPGLRELQLWNDSDGLAAAFDDIATLAEGCRFGDCRHNREPGCAVLAAVARGSLDGDRLMNWRKLQSEIAYLEARDNPHAQSEVKRRGAIGAKAARAHIRSKYK